MTRRASTTMVGAGVISVVAIAIAVTSAQQPALAPAPFTTEQATAGRAAYTRECAGCHRPDLRGSGEASALSSPNFMSAWGDRSIAELYTRIGGSMPPGRAGALADAGSLGIVAHILQTNGARGSGQPLTVFGSRADPYNGVGRTSCSPHGAGTRFRSSGRRWRWPRRTAGARPRGITLPGEVAELRACHGRDARNPAGP